jgi:hypothetical protein
MDPIIWLTNYVLQQHSSVRPPLFLSSALLGLGYVQSCGYTTFRSASKLSNHTYYFHTVNFTDMYGLSTEKYTVILIRLLKQNKRQTSAHTILK